MVRVLQWFFMILGMLFFGLLVAGAYLIIVDPFELRPLITLLRGGTVTAPPDTDRAPVDAVVTGDLPAEEMSDEGGVVSDESSIVAPVSVAPPFLTPEQTQVLEFVGIDPAILPDSISPEQEECFVTAIGRERVETIKAGAAPTPLEIFAARGCL